MRISIQTGQNRAKPPSRAAVGPVLPAVTDEVTLSNGGSRRSASGALMGVIAGGSGGLALGSYFGPSVGVVAGAAGALTLGAAGFDGGPISLFTAALGVGVGASAGAGFGASALGPVGAGIGGFFGGVIGLSAGHAVGKKMWEV